MEPAARGRGKRLLYWFRTPPGVRVGRAPIDEAAIRLLEQHNPDVEFDWTRILKAPPPGEGQGRRDSRDPRDRDQRGRREPRAGQRPRSAGGPPPAPARSRGGEERPSAPSREHAGSRVPESLVPGPSSSDSQAAEHPEHADFVPQAAEYADHADLVPQAAEYADHADLVSQAAEHAEHAEQTESLVPESLVPGPSSSDSQAAEHAEHAEQGEHTVALVPLALGEFEMPGMGEERAEERAADAGSASYVRLGAEGLVRLRARYAEVMARIAERPLEEATREELKLRAERLNPDAWVTADEVSAALEQYETVFEGLRGVVGRHPRRRRHGRR